MTDMPDRSTALNDNSVDTNASQPQASKWPQITKKIAKLKISSKYEKSFYKESKHINAINADINLYKLSSMLAKGMMLFNDIIPICLAQVPPHPGRRPKAHKILQRFVSVEFH